MFTDFLFKIREDSSGVGHVINNGVNFRLTVRPYLSLMYPKIKAPIGLARNPMAKIEKVLSNPVAGASLGKKSCAKSGAKNP